MKKRIFALLVVVMVMISSMSVFAYPDVDYNALPDIEGYVKANVVDNEIGSLYTEINDADPIGCAVVNIYGQNMLIYHGILVPFMCPNAKELAELKANYKPIMADVDPNYVNHDKIEPNVRDESEDIPYYHQLFAEYYN